VRGLRNPNQKALIICLQETFSKQEDEEVWSADWGGRIIFSHRTEHSKGVCMILNPTSNLQINTIESDPSGRYIILKVTMEGKDYFLINVCAPTDYPEQETFIRTLSGNIISKTVTSRVIAAGDWNTTLNKRRSAMERNHVQKCCMRSHGRNRFG